MGDNTGNSRTKESASSQKSSKEKSAAGSINPYDEAKQAIENSKNGSVYLRALGLNDKDFKRLLSDPDIQPYLPLIRELDLSNNRITEIPEELSKCTALESLSYTDTPIASILCTLPNLKIFYTSGSKHSGGVSIKSLDFLLGSPNMCELSIINDGISSLKSLPPEIWTKCRFLETVNLYGCNLTAIPAQGIQGLAHLRGFRLRRNQLSSVPEGIIRLSKSLVDLDLRDNNITSLPSGMRRLSYTSIALGGNPIDENIPSSLCISFNAGNPMERIYRGCGASQSLTRTISSDVDSQSDESSALSAGKAAGIAAGSVALTTALLVATIACMRYYRRRQMARETRGNVYAVEMDRLPTDGERATEYDTEQSSPAIPIREQNNEVGAQSLH